MDVQTRAFTLIELLVVVTIIAVLLALLTPALDKAMYQAELAVCASRLDGIASGADTYAFSNRRSYPYRKGVLNNGWQPNYISDSVTDDRTMIKPFIDISLLSDPLAGNVDFEDTTPPDVVFVNYSLWFGYRFLGQKGMLKMGDRMEFGGDSFNLLATDADVIQLNAGNAHGSHPDNAAKMVLVIDRNSPYGNLGGKTLTASNWTMDAKGSDRGPVDTNHAFADGSVRRATDVAWDDTYPANSRRMRRVPLVSNDADTAKAWRHMPSN